MAGEDSTKSVDLTLLFIPGYPVLIKICEPEIVELFELMRDNPNVDALIHGHVCCADDFKLSFDRALMVTDYLITRGISRDRITYKGHSNKDPKFSPEVTEGDRLANRRVTIDFTKK
ncbi:MAG: OmpA family protein [Crocinitomicaceae bacterium]|nr:OmpA family protein [Crocinitomicaceae bacterium]